jgi:protein arginine kinase activator
MLCDDCKERPASVHITQVNNNQKFEKHLCENCAQKSGELTFATESKFTVQDFLKGMFNHGFVNVAQPASEAPCPNCAMTYGDFSRGGKIGCSTCYATYGDRLEPLLRRIHGASSHTGKVPKRGGGKLSLRQQLLLLRRQLEGHVAKEEYEQAAKVRDEIRTLEQQTKD